MKRHEITKELEEMNSPLAAMPKAMPYHVPGGYFEQFTTSMSDLHSPAGEEIPAWSKAMPYTIPESYFDSLPDRMLAAARHADSGSTTPFAVPEGYFAQLPQQMLQAAKASGRGSGKLISFPGRAFKAAQWAAAAMFILFVGIGSYITFFSERIGAPESMLAAVTNTEIHDYLQGMYTIDIDRVENNDISNLHLDNNEIVQYLNETGWDMVE